MIKISHWCKHVDMTQAQMAADLGIPKTSLSRYSCLGRWPRPYELGMIDGYTEGGVDLWGLLKSHGEFEAGQIRGRMLRAKRREIEIAAAAPRK